MDERRDIMKILIVEPHYDDALLSCGMYIIENDYDVTILSIVGEGYNDKKETEQLCKKFNWKWINFNKPNISLKEFKKEYGNITYEKLEQYKETYNDVYEWIVNEQKNYDIIFLPLGIGHPVHELVSHWDFNVETIYYRDFPHSYKRTNQSQLKSKISGLSPTFIKAFIYKGNFNIKRELFKKIYKSQKSLLFFDKKFFDMQPNEEFYWRI